MGRDGPGLLLRDILKGDDPQVLAVLDILTDVNADILALQGIDYDFNLQALTALVAALNARGIVYPFVYAGTPNSGLMTTLDLDGDGRLGGAGDAQGYGRFYGQGSMAVLSRYPVDQARVRDYSTLLWQDVPDALLPETAAGPFPSQAALDVQRLSSKGHWALPVKHPVFGEITVMTFHASPPVFDGPEDRNGKRNHDEVMFWRHYLNGAFDRAPPKGFVLLGDANLDPAKGDGRSEAIRALLDDPRLQDPLPEIPTVSWAQVGNLRVDYVLPSADWRITGAAVHPPTPIASRHQLVWVDLTR